MEGAATRRRFVVTIDRRNFGRSRTSCAASDGAGVEKFMARGLLEKASEITMIDGLTNSTAISVLERMMQFTGQRHRLIANNIANLSTPGFRPVDVSVGDFQRQLGQAIDQRRAGHDESGGGFQMRSTREVEVDRTGLTLYPQPTGDNIMFHDGNDRDVERAMQSLVENFMTFRASTQLLKSRMESLHLAIRERL